ncbi:MAG TPA: RsmB/NOP family class I SAM-dependent RNA methyltransferase, partial [Actinomycetota bacterium]
TRIPDHAAVTETVGLVGRAERGFVNAVLRRLAASPPGEPAGTTIAAQSVRTGVAPWAIRELRALLGPEAEAAAAALAAPAPPSLRVNPCRATAEALAARLSEVGAGTTAGTLHLGTLRLDAPADPTRLPGFREGAFAIQDEASAWVVDVLDPQPGERVADLCAGPGGKAADIGCRAGGVVAADRSPARAALVRKAARRLGVPVTVVVQDAARPALRPGTFDRVLVDAPCSGIGSARRRPELLWRPRREDLAGLARLQLGILRAAAGLLRPGGVLVYSVCTFPAAETDRVCDALLVEEPTLAPRPFTGPEGTPVARARLWPHRHGTDGMFVARFEKA